MMEGYTILSLLLCLSVPSALANDVVRLAGEDGTTSQGRVEVYKDGSWGTVCNRNWEKADADVVCMQLGFSGADREITDSRFGEGSGKIHLDGLYCVGNETSIMNCDMSLFAPWDVCDHDMDAGVVCLASNVRKVEDLDFYQREDMMEEEKEKKAAAYERSDAKKDADLMKKDILQALYDLLVELEDK